MSFSMLHIFLAMFGLSFLVFIHELGHYIVARRVGMRVEVFSIGFGKPMFSWKRDGVKWQVCYLLFGGYVKIAGMEKEVGLEPYQVKDGFYGKRPWDRIKVAIVGPLVNIVFAFLVFTMIWIMGGREKRFEEFTNIIGSLDSKSELLQKGVKPGDTILEYGGKKFTGFKELLTGGVLNSDTIEIQGDKVDYYTNQKIPYQYNLQSYQMPNVMKGIKTIGVMPATYVLFYGFDPQMGKFSPAYQSGIQKNDRVIWANGEAVFSVSELSNIVNRGDVFLTIDRNGSIIHLRVPRVLLEDLQINPSQRDEFLDWKRALGMTTSKEDLFFIPYEIDVLGTVKGKFNYIDSDLDNESLSTDYKVPGLDNPLLQGDQIIAVNGKVVSNGLQIFDELRTNKVLLVVERAPLQQKVLWNDANSAFISSINWNNLRSLTENIGTAHQVDNLGNLVLLNPIEPKTRDEFLAPQQVKNDDYEFQFVKSLKRAKKEPLYIFAGAITTDKAVIYNPSPIRVFQDVVLEIGGTLSSLISGSISPKWLSGPVGIVKIVQQSLSVGIVEALYWLGLISLNLGLINLLPIPVLDGGHICFSLWEWITGKRISSKVQEKIILPFVILMIAFFVYVTIHDVFRLF